MSFGGLLGGGAVDTTPKGEYINEDGKQVVDGYEVADAEDMEWLASIL